MARLRRAGPPGPGRAPGMGARLTEEERWTGEGGPAVGAWGCWGSLAAGGRRPGPAALALGTHGAGRRRSAVPPHPPPGGARRYVPRGSRLPERPGRPPRAGRCCRRERLPVKGAAACGLRVPPLRSGQTPDRELPRQDPAPAGRTGAEQAHRVHLALCHPLRPRLKGCSLLLRACRSVTVRERDSMHQDRIAPP